MSSRPLEGFKGFDTGKDGLGLSVIINSAELTIELRTPSPSFVQCVLADLTQSLVSFIPLLTITTRIFQHEARIPEARNRKRGTRCRFQYKSRARRPQTRPDPHRRHGKNVCISKHASNLDLKSSL